MIEHRALVQPIHATLIAVPVLLTVALVYAAPPRIDPRVVGDWQGRGGGDPLLKLTKDGRYVSENLTQTKTIPPEVGTYTVLPLPKTRVRGRLAGAEIVRLRHVLPEDVARILHQDPLVVRDLIYVPGVPALVEDAHDFVPAKDNGSARDHLVRWLALP